MTSHSCLYVSVGKLHAAKLLACTLSNASWCSGLNLGSETAQPGCIAHHAPMLRHDRASWLAPTASQPHAGAWSVRTIYAATPTVGCGGGPTFSPDSWTLEPGRKSRETPASLMVTVRMQPPEDPSRPMASDTAFTCEAGQLCYSNQPGSHSTTNAVAG